METAHIPHYKFEKYMKLELLCCKKFSDNIYGFIG